MGCPDIYYKDVMQTFARALHLEVHGFSNAEIMEADRYLEEIDMSRLIEAINKFKEQVDNNKFYFIAGQSLEYVLNDADKNGGCDGFNACISGLNQFKAFLGLEKHKDG